MTGMGTHSAARGGSRHLWVIGVIAAAAAAEVFATWAGLGGVAGFPVLSLGRARLSMGWTLAIGTEAYAGYALWAWLSGAAGGTASRRFAMWSALGMLTLSLVGQVAYHLMLAASRQRPPAGVVGFVACLPVAVLMTGAILAHLMHDDAVAAREAEEDRAQAERQAAIERAEADERTALRAELAAAREAHAAELCGVRDELAADRSALAEVRQVAARLAARQDERDRENAAFQEERDAAQAALAAERASREAAEGGRTEAERRAADAEARAERLNRKLGANSGAGRNRNAGGKGAAKSRTTVPNDVDARAQALMILGEEPGITGKELGERCGRGERWGQLRKSELAAHVADGGSRAAGGGE